MATQLLHEAGVSLISGTDSGSFAIIPGASMARELELLVEADLTPHEALASVTQVSATVLGFEQTGVIAPSYRANLVLLPQDPLTKSKRSNFLPVSWLEAIGLTNLSLRL
jgi:imidazolonepropionase-like amidohydrolase